MFRTRLPHIFSNEQTFDWIHLLQSEDVVMQMEFEDAEGVMSSEDVGLAARLSKKTKTQAKEKGKTGDTPPQFHQSEQSGQFSDL